MTTTGFEETHSLLQQSDSSVDATSPFASLSSPSVPRWRTGFRHLLRCQRDLLYPIAVFVLLLLLALSIYLHLTQNDVFLTSDDFPVAWDCPPPLPSAPFASSRVLILTTDNRTLPAVSDLSDDVSRWPYALLTHYLNTRYAAYHGYVHQRMTKNIPSARSSVWSKVYHLTHSIDWRAYDYVVAVDSDAWFTHLHYPLHDMLHCFAPDALPSTSVSSTTVPSFSSTAPHFLFSKDFPLHERNEHDLNAGVFIMRTSPGARAILELWWQLAELPQHSHLLTDWPAEQGVLNEMLMKNASVAASIRVLPRQVIYGHAAAYINHVTSWWPLQKGWQGRREALVMRDIVRADMQEIPK